MPKFSFSCIETQRRSGGQTNKIVYFVQSATKEVHNETQYFDIVGVQTDL